MHTDYNVYMGNIIIIILSTHPLSFRRVKPVLFTTLEFNACKKYIRTQVRAHMCVHAVYSLFIIFNKDNFTAPPPMTKAFFFEN